MAEKLIQQVDIKAPLAGIALSQGADETAPNVVQIETMRPIEITLANRDTEAPHPPTPIGASSTRRRSKNPLICPAAGTAPNKNINRRRRQRQAVRPPVLHPLSANGNALLVQVDFRPQQPLRFLAPQRIEQQESDQPANVVWRVGRT